MAKSGYKVNHREDTAISICDSRTAEREQSQHIAAKVRRLPREEKPDAAAIARAKHAYLARLKTRADSGVRYEHMVETTLDALAAHLEAHLDVDRMLSLAR